MLATQLTHFAIILKLHKSTYCISLRQVIHHHGRKIAALLQSTQVHVGHLLLLLLDRSLLEKELGAARHHHWLQVWGRGWWLMQMGWMWCYLFPRGNFRDVRVQPIPVIEMHGWPETQHVPRASRVQADLPPDCLGLGRLVPVADSLGEILLVGQSHSWHRRLFFCLLGDSLPESVPGQYIFIVWLLLVWLSQWLIYRSYLLGFWWSKHDV